MRIMQGDQYYLPIMIESENGTWVLQTELSAVLDETVKYRKME